MKYQTDRAPQSHKRTQLIRFALVLTGFTFAAMPVYAEKTTIYKSLAGDGSVQFTDKATPEAVIITPSPLNVVDAPTSQTDQANANSAIPSAVQAPSNVATTEPSGASTQSITSVNISSPLNKETLIDHQGPIWVAIETTPSPNIPAGLTAEVMLNGKRIVTGSSARLPFEVPERGTHQVQVRIVDQKGRVTAESAMHEIHIKKRVARNAN